MNELEKLLEELKKGGSGGYTPSYKLNGLICLALYSILKLLIGMNRS